MLVRPDVFRRLCEARDALEAGPLEAAAAPSIHEVALRAGISTFHFIRQFESVFGLTPHRLRTRSRLDRARLLLAEGRLSVTDVCMEIGFSSLGSFSDLFARRVGEPPSSYRRRARSMVTVPGAPPRELFPGCLSLMARLPVDAFRNSREAAVATV